MPAHYLEFSPGPLDSDTIASGIQADLEAFNRYVQQEALGVQLFGSIVHRLLEERSNETRIETDVSSGKVGLEVAELTGNLPRRLTDPNTPLVQEVDYPPVHLPDGTYALLREVVHRRKGVDTEVVARIPWLFILPEKVLADHRNGKVVLLTDVALEAYCQADLDRTGITDGEPPFSTAHTVFFSHPLEQWAVAELERDKNNLIQEQGNYLTRLRAIAALVLNKTPED